MTALVRYQLELQLRCYAWLAPFLTYALLMVLGVTGGDEPAATFAYSSGVLVLITIWFVRTAATAEPPAARACLVVARGAVRVQLAALLTALTQGLTLALAGWAMVLLVSGRAKADAVATAGFGLYASLVCVLLGLLVGALCSPPVLARAQYGIPLSLTAATLLLAVEGSPANAVIRALITAARTGSLQWPLAALPETVVLAGLAVAVSLRRAKAENRTHHHQGE